MSDGAAITVTLSALPAHCERCRRRNGGCACRPRLLGRSELLECELGYPPRRARALTCKHALATLAHEHAHDTRHSQRLHARRSRRGGAVGAVRAGEGGFARIARGKDTMGIESLELLTVHADTTEALAHSHAALPPAPPLCPAIFYRMIQRHLSPGSNWRPKCILYSV